MLSTIEYVADLCASVTMLLFSYHANSWCLWAIGLGALVLTIASKNIAAWAESKREKTAREMLQEQRSR